MTDQELHEANIKLPQAIVYILETNTRLLEEIANLQYERDEYRKKYLNECELRERTKHDNTLPAPDTEG